MIGIDANFLIACEIQEHDQHIAVHEILSELVDEGETFALAPQVLAEFLHIVTDDRRLKRPLAMRRALERAELWRTAVDAVMVTPTAEGLELFFHWMGKHRLGRKRVLDTMLGATFAAAGIRRIATINVGDFEVFGVFECVAPKGIQ